VSTPYPTASRILLRLALALLGGWFFVRYLLSASIATLVAAGIEYETAWMTGIMLAFVVYLVVLLWAFAAKQVLRVAVVLVGGGTLLAVLGWWLVPRLAVQ
jgi:hypothetical protein